MAVLKPLVICGKSAVGPNDAPTILGAVTDPCGFSHLVLVGQHVIYNLVMISTLLAVVVFIYAGFLLMTSGGNSGKKDEAKKMLMKVLWGYLWILVAWLLIYTITKALVDPVAYPSPLIGTPQQNPTITP
jgi:hypothetical protein